MKRMTYTVSDVAKLARVTVRTLHHYDAIGLLVPSARSEAGYRLYGDADLERLHEIMLLRELGFPLEEIRRTLADPGRDRAADLRAQRELVLEQVRRNEAMLRAIDDALAALEGGKAMDPKTMFDGFDPAAHEAEAEQRWGDTEAFKESKRRTSRYGKDDWEAMKAEAGAILRDLAAAMAAGKPAAGAEARAAAERHRAHIDRWFYPCDQAMHEKLTELYENDGRYAQAFEKVAKGLAAYLIAAIRANGGRARP